MAANAEQASDSQPKAKIFISYSRKDLSFVDQLVAALRTRGFEPLVDRTEIYAFEEWWPRIEALIGDADTIVYVLSPNSIGSDIALKEVMHGASLHKRFAPIVMRRVADAAIPEPLRKLNFIFFDDPTQFEANADKLAEALQTDIIWIRRHTEFSGAARRWLDGARASGLLLRPPALDQAEAWMAFRPGGAPSPTEETQAFIFASRTAELQGKRRSRAINFTLYAMLIGIIVGLVGWINQESISNGWRFLTVTLPYARASVWPYVLSTAREQALEVGRVFTECSQNCPEMVVIAGGSFVMGASMDESKVTGYASRTPQHSVTIAARFAVSKYPVTFDEWDSCVAGGGCDGYRPVDRDFGRGRQPAIFVNWDDAHRYVAWLSLVTGKTYRLLSEAEYEYAARGGASTPFPWGNDTDVTGKAMADCDGCGSEWDNHAAAPVGSFSPNGFGLFDMVGNIWEWTEDCLHKDYEGAPADGSAWLTDSGGNCDKRMLRGGSWINSPDWVTSAARSALTPDLRGADVGFRVARTLTP